MPALVLPSLPITLPADALAALAVSAGDTSAGAQAAPDFAAVLTAQLALDPRLGLDPLGRPAGHGEMASEPTDPAPADVLGDQLLTAATGLAEIPLRIAAPPAQPSPTAVELPASGRPAPVLVAAAPVPEAPSSAASPAGAAATPAAPAAIAAAIETQPSAASAPVLAPSLDAQLRDAPAASEPTTAQTQPTQVQALQPPGREQPPVDTPVRLGARTFADDVGGRVAWMVANGRHSAELRIDPPQLGPIEVRLTLNGDQASVTLVSPHAAVRDALQASLPRLHEMLLGSGVDLGSVHVGSEASHGDSRREAHPDRTLGASWAGTTAEGVGRDGGMRLGQGLVDTYA